VRRLLAALGLVGAAIGAVWATRRWHPRTMVLSGETLAELARRHDTAGLGEVNDKDPYPFSARFLHSRPRALGDKPGVRRGW